MNNNHDNQHESIEEQIERLEAQNLRLETQLIEAVIRPHRVARSAAWTSASAA